MSAVLDLDGLLRHWQGHRRLTRRTIAAFPEDSLFSFSIAGMRPFGEMVGELLEVKPLLHGITQGEWEWRLSYAGISEKASLLEAWDDSTAVIGRYWPRLTIERLQEVEEDRFFGGPPQANLDRLLYQIDNEIHHRGQAYVYLRELGIEPPPFYER